MQNKAVNNLDYRIKYPTRNLVKSRNQVSSKETCSPKLAALVNSFKKEAHLWKKYLKSRPPMTCGNCSKNIRNFALRTQGQNEGNLICSCNSCSFVTILRPIDMQFFVQEE